MEKIKCPECGKEIDKYATVCEWCGCSIIQKEEEQPVDESVENDEKSEETVLVSEETGSDAAENIESDDSENFTDDDSDDNFDILTGEEIYNGNKPKKKGWTMVSAIVGVLMIVAIAALFIFADQEQNEGRMPNYDNFTGRQEQLSERQQEKENARKEETQRIQDELKRASDAEARRLEQELESTSLDETELEEEDLDVQVEDAVIQEITEETVE